MQDYNAAYSELAFVHDISPHHMDTAVYQSSTDTTHPGIALFLSRGLLGVRLCYHDKDSEMLLSLYLAVRDC